ncbi:MAG TPA: peptide-methionine (R)-S-oxide reductase MsrB [Bryobacteraceae bacterium]|nr:peptide-methionine (R)-S-oxide reductase MsrB [Bryobacteraceae bacterium]
MAAETNPPRYERRAFVALAAVGSGGYFWWMRSAPAAKTLPARVRIATFDAHGQKTDIAEVDTIRKSDGDWKKELPADSYSVARRGDTEFAGTGAYDRFYGDGLYRCVCCGTALFDSAAKFASGTGWPSFTGPIAKENIVEVASSWFGIAQTEVKCARCDSHLGHVFDDGPPPANLRYCINSVALRFVGRSA